MKRYLISIAAALAAAAILAGCGAAVASTSSNATTSAAAATVSSRQVSGVGSVLVDKSGLALYASDQETGGMARCTGACTSFWKPLTVNGTAPTGSDISGTLGTVKRADGTTQVTYNGKLLYTFSLDKPGHVNGNGFSDAFGSQKFTWHAVLAGAASGSSGSGQTGGGSQSSRPAIGY